MGRRRQEGWREEGRAAGMAGVPIPSPAGDGTLDGPSLDRVLATSPIVEVAHIPWASNAVFQVRLDTPHGPRLAIYKPARGERPLWDFPAGTLHRREVAVARVDQALGWGFTPRTVLRRDGPFGRGSIQEFIEDPDPAVVPRGAALQEALAGMAVLDVLVNNADRKRAHLLVDPQGRLRGIDHGVTFHVEPKLRTVLLELGGTPVPARWLRDLRRFQADDLARTALARELSTLLSPGETAAFDRRMRQLLQAGVFPVLDPWRGQPWEW
ncbi:MAG TPA: hypothetical protein VNN74_08150 [Candidatus Micrarchaeia archaeon]|nr:hypothetical protein [Candidatus Micrarchaeia archaeon]